MDAGYLKVSTHNDIEIGPPSQQTIAEPLPCFEVLRLAQIRHLLVRGHIPQREAHAFAQKLDHLDESCER